MEGSHDDRARLLLGRVATLTDRHRGPRPALGAGQSAAFQDHRNRWTLDPEPPAFGHRHHELLVLAAVAAALESRVCAGVAGALSAARVFQPGFSTVSDLAAVRHGTHDGVVLVQHDRA